MSRGEKGRPPHRPCEQAYLNLRNHRVGTCPPSVVHPKAVFGTGKPGSRQIGVGSTIVLLITNRAGTSESSLSFRGDPGVHGLFDLTNETLCLLLQLDVSGVLIRFSLLEQLVRDIQRGQDGNLDRVYTGASISDLAHAVVNKSRQLLEARCISIRTNAEPLAENLDSGSNGRHQSLLSRLEYSA